MKCNTCNSLPNPTKKLTLPRSLSLSLPLFSIKLSAKQEAIELPRLSSHKDYYSAPQYTQPDPPENRHVYVLSGSKRRGLSRLIWSKGVRNASEQR